MRVLARAGTGGASVRTIAAEAGVSPGLVTHHFGSVDALIAATYAHVGEQVDEALEAAVAAAGDGAAGRLTAYVEASFAPPVADPDLLATWTAFWSLVRNHPGIAALHEQSYARYRLRLEELLVACGMAPDRLRLAAIGITALVDGLWLELCLSPGNFSPDEARTIASGYIAGLVNATGR